MRRMMRAGAGRARIDFTGVLPHAGFTVQRHDLRARVLIIEGEAVGGGMADASYEMPAAWAFVSIEATSLRTPVVEAVREAVAKASGLPKGAVWVCPTHSFSVPHVRTPEHLVSDGERVRNERLFAAIVTAAREAAERARAAMEPARLSFGAASCAAGASRDVPTSAGWWLGCDLDAPADRTVRVLVVRDKRGYLLALLASMDLPSSVLDGLRADDGGRIVARDIAEETCMLLESEWGTYRSRVDLESVLPVRPASGFAATRRPVCLFAYGCGGDQTPVLKMAERHILPNGEVCEQRLDAEQADGLVRLLATRVAASAIEAVETATELAATSLQTIEVTCTLAGQVGAASPRDVRPTRAYRYEQAPPRATTVHVCTFGGLGIVGFMPEISSAMGAELRAHLPFRHALVLTMTNGGQKYLMEKAAYDRCTYEAMNSSFARGAGERLLAETVAFVTRWEHV